MPRLKVSASPHWWSSSLIISFFKELQLLNQGGSNDVFIQLGLLGLLAGGTLAIGTVEQLDRQPWADIAAKADKIGVLRYGMAAIAVLLSLSSAGLVYKGGSPTIATIAWAVGLVLVLSSSVEAGMLHRARLRAARLRSLDVRGACPALIVLAILVAAAALRLTALDSIPGYVHNDEASNGLMARAVADGQVASLFSNGWANLPMLGYAWEALFFKLFGDSLLSLRLASAVLGIASVLVTALLGKELFSLQAA